MYKFRDVNSNESTFGDHKQRTALQAEFTSYLSVASSVPNILFLVLNTALTHKLSLQKRVVGSLLAMTVFFIITTVFVNINTDTCKLKDLEISKTNLLICCRPRFIFWHHINYSSLIKW